MVKVSILIVAYNQEKYIAEAIDGVLMQQHAYTQEIIFLDDNSKDRTFQIAKQMLGDRADVTLIQNENNLGITRNYQKGFSLCKGEYVFIVEGDDYWLYTGKIREQVCFMDTHPKYALCFHPYIIQNDHSSIFTSMDFSSFGGRTSFGINDLIQNEWLIGNFTVCCYRKQLLDKLPTALFELKSYDWIINIFMGHMGLLKQINQQMSVYRHADNAQWSKMSRERQINEMIDIIPSYDKLLEGIYGTYFEQKRLQLLLQIRSEKRSGSKLYRWLPPFIPKIIRLLVPPALK